MAHHIRLSLKKRLAWAVVPILSGPLKNAWFGLFTGTRFLRGTYGAHESTAMVQLLRRGDVVYDVGAHVGYFTLLAARSVGRDGKLFSFEPFPANLAYLRRHCQVNRLANATILPVAVGRVEETRSFQSASGTGRGRLGNAGGVRNVRVVSLDDLWKQGELPPPNLIKMDIEGSEGEALRGAAELLARFRPTILLSMHGDAAKKDCESFLAGLGYRFSYFKGSTIVASASTASAVDQPAAA